MWEFIETENIWIIYHFWTNNSASSLHGLLDFWDNHEVAKKSGVKIDDERNSIIILGWGLKINSLKAHGNLKQECTDMQRTSSEKESDFSFFLLLLFCKATKKWVSELLDVCMKQIHLIYEGYVGQYNIEKKSKS